MNFSTTFQIIEMHLHLANWLEDVNSVNLSALFYNHNKRYKQFYM